MSFPNLDLAYAYEFQKKRYLRFWQKPLHLVRELVHEIHEDALLVPPRPSEKPFGNGGAIDRNGKQLPLSWLRYGKRLIMGEPSIGVDTKPKTMPGEFIYLGHFFNHWGHFLIDNCPRLYGAITRPDSNYVFLSSHPVNKANVLAAIKRFFNLLGINFERVYFISNVVRIESLNIFEAAYIPEEYISQHFFDVFRYVARNIKPSIPHYEKVYFSRSHLKENRDFGGEVIDDLFESAGYATFYPEKLALDDQINLIVNCKSYACVAGTLVHNLFFACCKEKEVTIVARSYWVEAQFFDTLKSLKGKIIWADFFIYPYPIRITTSPFFFLCNQNMLHFMAESKISAHSPELYSRCRSVVNLMSWLSAYLKTLPLANLKLLASAEKKDHFFYDINLYKESMKLFNEFGKSPDIVEMAHEYGEQAIEDAIRLRGYMKKMETDQCPLTNSPEYGREKMVPVSAQRINMLGQLRQCKTYLEIGVCKGETFTEVNIKNKVGVDPDFRFDVNCYADNQEINLFKMTSDTFFSYLAKNEYPCSIKVPFDIIYIDGLHTFKQSINDFMNTITYSHMNTIWLFDDTVPMDPYTALPDQGKAGLYRKMAGLKVGPWHGDVFKSIFAIHDFFPYFSYATVIDNGNPQTIVWRTVLPAQRKPLYLSRNEIENMSYFDMLENCALLNPVNDADLLSEIGTTFNMPPTSSSEYLAAILHKLWLA